MTDSLPKDGQSLKHSSNTNASKDLNYPRRLFTKWKKLMKKVEKFLDSTPFVVLMSLITVYVLFADDIRTLIVDKSVDNGFYGATSVGFALFSIEIILSCLAKPGYFLGFYFWLDLLSTVTLIFDIGWISDLIFGTGSSSNASNAAKLAKAGRASRVGTRAARIVRIVRLIRLIRIVKLYKAAQTTMNQNFDDAAANDMADDESREGTFSKTYSGLVPFRALATFSPNQEGGSQNNLDRKGSLTDVNRRGTFNTPQRRESRLSQDVRKGSIDRPHVPIVPLPLIKEEGMNDPEPRTSMPADFASTQIPFGVEATSPDPMLGASPTPQKQEITADLAPTPGIVPTPGIAPSPGITPTPAPEASSDPAKFELPQETNVGKRLSDLTTKRVVTLIMCVLISIPIFTVDTYVSDYTSCESGLYSVWALNQSLDSAAYDIGLNNYINQHKDIRNPLLVLTITSTSYYPYREINEDDLRSSEKQYYFVNGADGSTLAYSLFDQRDDTHLNAILSISRTLFVVIVLTIAAIYFSKDSNELVLVPIENMLVKVKRIAENPLAAAQIEEEDALLQDKLEKEGKLKDFMKKNDDGNYETNILEKTILKLGALLALGFGEAGSNIIAQNMSKSGDVDPMIPGKKVMAIFGFCDIRQFTDATEVLQEGVMVFVNEIAEIVHGTINEYSGAANKNIGDAFLLVWKFPEEEVEVDPEDESNLKLKEGSIKVSQLADMSVMSFMKVLASINRSKKLDKYRHNAGLNQRIKNYSVKMGFGLHVGWAIEGAIGSEYKIDASYLSPNVNMASRLEAATKQFGVPLLISGALQAICSNEAKKCLRHIDRVTVKGSVQPVDLYTCDAEFHKLTVNQNEADLSNQTATEKKQARVQSRSRRNDLREKAFSGKIKIAKRFTTDKDIAAMRRPYTKEFEDKFREGMENYISGNWSKARDAFEITIKMLPTKEKDGPSNTLLTYMGEFGFRAPHDWKGFRELTEK